MEEEEELFIQKSIRKRRGESGEGVHETRLKDLKMQLTLRAIANAITFRGASRRGGGGGGDYSNKKRSRRISIVGGGH